MEFLQNISYKVQGTRFKVQEYKAQEASGCKLNLVP